MDKDKQIIIGSDHAAFGLKEKSRPCSLTLAMRLRMRGTHSEASVNYADYGKKVAQAVLQRQCSAGDSLCGTGLGMSMQANRFKGVRAALCSDIFSVRMSRQHNDANILVLGGRVVGDILAFELVKEWLDTPFEGGAPFRPDSYPGRLIP